MDEQNDEEGLIIIPSKKVLKKCKTSPVLQKWGGFCSGVFLVHAARYRGELPRLV